MYNAHKMETHTQTKLQLYLSMYNISVYII